MSLTQVLHGILLGPDLGLRMTNPRRPHENALKQSLNSDGARLSQPQRPRLLQGQKEHLPCQPGRTRCGWDSRAPEPSRLARDGIAGGAKNQNGSVSFFRSLRSFADLVAAHASDSFACCLAVAVLWPASSLVHADNWPQFRGPSGLGYTSEKNLPLRWDGAKGENVVWKSPLIGSGHASPIVWGDRVFVCTVRWQGGKPDPTVIPEHHVVCYAATDGKQLWDTQVVSGPWVRDDFRSGAGGGYAAPTPATDGQRLFVVFGSSVMAALDFDGKIAWRQVLTPHTFDVTIGSSPILYQDTVILLCAMAKPADSRLVAFKKSDGKIKWETKLPRTGFGHSTPMVIDVKGRPQLIALASGMAVADEALQSFDPATGQRLWWCRAAGDASSPAYGSGILYVDSGRGAKGTAVDATGLGDVSGSHVRWTVGPLSESIGSPIIVGDHVFRLLGSGVVKVWKVANGEETDRQRLENIGSTWASPVADATGRIYFANGGRSYVAQAGPQIRVLAVNDLSDPNHASPAVSNGRLFIVSLKNIYCLGTR